MDFEQQEEECEYFRHKTTELEEQLQKQTKLKEEAEEQKQVCGKKYFSLKLLLFLSLIIYRRGLIKESRSWLFYMEYLLGIWEFLGFLEFKVFVG